MGRRRAGPRGRGRGAVPPGADRRAPGRYRAQEEVLYLWSGAHVKRLVPGFEHLAADLYWLRTVQYFGGQRLFAKDKKFDLLFPLIEITTTLDPRLEIAYRYGAMFLSEPAARSAPAAPTSASRCWSAGVANIPTTWRLRQELGLLPLHLPQRRRRAAARVLMEASEIPGAAFWLKTLAAEVLGKGGERGPRAAHVARDVRAVRAGSHQGERARRTSWSSTPRRPRRR